MSGIFTHDLFGGTPGLGGSGDGLGQTVASPQSYSAQFLQALSPATAAASATLTPAPTIAPVPAPAAGLSTTEDVLIGVGVVGALGLGGWFAYRHFKKKSGVKKNAKARRGTWTVERVGDAVHVRRGGHSVAELVIHKSGYQDWTGHEAVPAHVRTRAARLLLGRA